MRCGVAQVREKLSKAPIIEAVLDFRARLAPQTPRESLKAAVEQVAPLYPILEDSWLLEGSLEISAAGSASTSSKRENGYVVSSEDRTQVVQFRLDGFTFSRLAPYTSWSEIAPEAFRLWDVYKAVAKPIALYRIALRYINVIRFATPSVEMDDVLSSAPKVPSELPQLFEGFVTRVVVPLESNTHATIIQAYNVPPAAVGNSLLLDVDVYRLEDLGLEAEAIRPAFELLRKFKNQAFFGSLTENMVRSLE
jgi:uncharacterized protein (TIGR04255 family)